MFEKIREDYKKSIKSFDTEENIDLCLFHPAGFAWACFFRNIGITPNIVTIASIFIGMAGGACFYPDNIYINLVGILLLIWAGMYDGADGMLARLTGQKTELGRFLDGIAGDLWFLAIYLAIIFRTNNSVGFFQDHKWVIWVLAISAAICHSVQAAIADRYRQMHLLFEKGDKGSELDSFEELKRNYMNLKWNQNFWKKIYLFLYSGYTKIQVKLSPSMENLITAIKEKYPCFILPLYLREDFRKLSFPFCKWENFMTFNWRAIFLCVLLLTGYPWIYLLVELSVFNIVLVFVVVYHEKVCRVMMRLLEYNPNPGQYGK
ncbi:MAG: CDP-alcohol phosphatidyltransferase family protein [Muribaculaceae bacterium]|nr:CDP-alcohol phosphatidyltransferase family protein [Muribaculaceae bacterium]